MATGFAAACGQHRAGVINRPIPLDGEIRRALEARWAPRALIRAVVATTSDGGPSTTIRDILSAHSAFALGQHRRSWVPKHPGCLGAQRGTRMFRNNAAELLAAGYTYRQSGLRQGGTCSCGGARGNTKSDARRAVVEKDARNLLRGLGIADPSDAQVKPIIDALIAQLDGENGAEPGTSGSPTANLVLVVDPEDPAFKAMTVHTRPALLVQVAEERGGRPAGYSAAPVMAGTAGRGPRLGSSPWSRCSAPPSSPAAPRPTTRPSGR